VLIGAVASALMAVLPKASTPDALAAATSASVHA
jgi:hypothetical protein